MYNIDTFVRNNEMQYIGELDESEIHDAENILSIKFPEEVVNYLQKYGCLSYKYIEFYGLGVPEKSHLNMCTVTKELQQLNLPEGFFAIENLDDGHYAICNQEGKVFEWSPESMDHTFKQISDGFNSYVFQKLDFAKNN